MNINQKMAFSLRMELEHIKLSDEMRERLEQAFNNIKYEYRESKDQGLLLRAFSAAMWEDTRHGERNFGLAQLTENQKKESAALASRLVEIATASGSPAAVIDNLPTNRELYVYALTGISLSINSGHLIYHDSNNGRYKREKGHDTSRAERDNVLITRTGDRAINQHAKQILHSDSAGRINPLVQMIGCEAMGARPLSTVVAPISEIIDETVRLIHEKTSEYGNEEELQKKVVTALKAPVWEEVVMFSDIPGQTKNLTTKAAIFENPNTTPNAPQYGLLRDLRNLKLSDKIEDDDLTRRGIDRKFLDIVRDNCLESLDTMKQKASGLFIRKGQALLWNENFVVHGTGTFMNDGPFSTRTMYLFQTPAGFATECGQEKTPGAVPLSCALQSDHPINIGYNLQTKI